MTTTANMDVNTKASQSHGLFTCFAMPALVLTALWLIAWVSWSLIHGLAMWLQTNQPWTVVSQWIGSFSVEQRCFAFGALVSLTFSKLCISLKKRQTEWSHRLMMAPLFLTSLFFFPILMSFQKGELGAFSFLLMFPSIIFCICIDVFLVTMNLPRDNLLKDFHALWALMAFAFSGYFGYLGREAEATVAQVTSNQNTGDIGMALFFVALSLSALAVFVSLFRLKEVAHEEVSRND